MNQPNPSDSLIFWMGSWECIFREVTFENGELSYRTGTDFFDKTTGPLRCTPDQDRWASFWTAIERIGVWDWKPDYSDTGVLDGTQWSLRMRHNGRVMSSEGDNDYPGGVDAEFSDDSPFGQFLAALAQLLGVKQFYEPES
jgi:hypothetical protein